ncbi:hypothetical protein BLOT_003868 [Blomia tropicalis]|nr:hypothetical protein BLOT_003868 [Blomia tropicalis]
MLKKKNVADHIGDCGQQLIEELWLHDLYRPCRIRYECPICSLSHQRCQRFETELWYLQSGDMYDMFALYVIWYNEDTNVE